MSRLSIIVISLLFFNNPILFAQQNSAERLNDSIVKAGDSIENEKLIILSTKQLQELQEAYLKDSIKRAQLEEQLLSLQSTDNLKKQELLTQLQELKSVDSIRTARKKEKIDSLRNVVKGYPVSPFLNDTLFFIYTKLGSFNIRKRADAISERIKELAGQYRFKADSLKIVRSDQTADLSYGDYIVMSINENDALWMNSSVEELAEIYQRKIVNAIQAYRNETSWSTLLKEIGLAALVLVLLFSLIFLVNRLFHFTRKKLESQKGKRIKGIKINNYELIDASKELQGLLLINTILKWVVVLLTVYFTFPLLFSIFPWTRKFSDTLLGYITVPLGNIFQSIWNYLPNLFTIILLVVIFHYVVKGLHFLKFEVERGALHLKGFYPEWASPTYQIIRMLLYAFMLIVIFPYLPGSESPVFRGVTVFVGVLITFSSSGSLSNIIAGFVLTYMRAFKMGDRVLIGEVKGDIVEKSLLAVRLRTNKNEIVSIPNSVVMNSHATNYSADITGHGLILHTTVTIGYDVPWRLVHKLMIEAALATEFVEKEPSPFVLQTSLDDFYVSYQINVYTKVPTRQARMYSKLHQNIQDKFNEAGVEIMSPHYRNIRDGNETTIPPDYRSPGYEPPFFRVTPDQKKEEE